MIHCKELNKDFNSKEEMFDQLRKYSEKIIESKKAQIYKSIDKGLVMTAKPIDHNKLSLDSTKGLAIDDNHYYIAVNSTKILDSHGDLHLDGIWKRTVKNQQGKNYLLADHKAEMGSTVAKKEHVEMFTAVVPFSVIGKSYKGDTEILVYKVRKDKVMNQNAKDWLDSGDAIEASVRMQYVDMMFAANSDAPEDKQAKRIFDKYVGQIANIEDFENEINYFWPVKEAKNIHESSLVLFGSNPSTGQIQSDSQPIKITGDHEPDKSTQETKALDEILKNLKSI